MVRWAGIAVPRVHTQTEEDTAADAMIRAAMSYLDEVENLDAAPVVLVTQLRQILVARLNGAHADPDEATPDSS